MPSTLSKNADNVANIIASKLGIPRHRVSQVVLAAMIASYYGKIIHPKLMSMMFNNVTRDPKKEIPSANIGNRPENKMEEDAQKSKAMLDKNENALKNPAVNKIFLQQLQKLIKVMVPKIWSRESLLLFSHTLTLAARTFISIYVALLEGRMVKYIVRKDVQNFSLMLLRWLLIALPATFINSMIRFLESHLAMRFRTRLVRYAYKLYFQNQTYYRVSNLDGRIDNADHCLTDDITTFTSSVAHLYSHLTKPILDLILITVSLYNIGKGMGASTVPGIHITFSPAVCFTQFLFSFLFFFVSNVKSFLAMNHNFNSFETKLTVNLIEACCRSTFFSRFSLSSIGICISPYRTIIGWNCHLSNWSNTKSCFPQIWVSLSIGQRASKYESRKKNLKLTSIHL